MKRVKKVTEQNCAQEVHNCPLPVLLDFYADWCEPCKAMEPIIKGVAMKYKGRLKVCKVNVENEPDLCAEYGIQSIPTIMLFSGGEVVTMFTGSISAKALDAAVESLVEE
jgi:thioredoxin 1